MEIGRICVKIAGRDAGKKCVVVEAIDSNYVLIDGQTRRRKCNIRHLEPLPQMAEIKKGADHEAVKKALKTLGIEVTDTKAKKKSEKPTKKKKAKAEKTPKMEKKTETKPETKKETPKKGHHTKPPKK